MELFEWPSMTCAWGLVSFDYNSIFVSKWSLKIWIGWWHKLPAVYPAAARTVSPPCPICWWCLLVKACAAENTPSLVLISRVQVTQSLCSHTWKPDQGNIPKCPLEWAERQHPPSITASSSVAVCCFFQKNAQLAHSQNLGLVWERGLR